MASIRVNGTVIYHPRPTYRYIHLQASTGRRWRQRTDETPSPRITSASGGGDRARTGIDSGQMKPHPRVLRLHLGVETEPGRG